MRRFLLVLMVVAGSCAHVRTVAQREIASTVRLEITEKLTLGDKSVEGGGSCSGVAISNDLILTAAHCAVAHVPPELAQVGVVGTIESITAFSYANQELCQVDVVKVDVALDLALLKARCWLPDSSPVGKYEPPSGSKVLSVGYPLGIEYPIMTDGYLTVTIHGGDLDGTVVTSFPVLPGNSGGPVFYDGAVVGIVSRGTPRSNHHVGFSASWSSIRAFLKR